MALTEWGIEGYTYKFDADGNAVFIRPDNPVGFDGGLYFTARPALWTNISHLPRRKAQDMVRELATTVDYPLKTEFQLVNLERKYKQIQDKTSLLPFATKKEMERIQAITPDLNAYSEELLTSLIMGDKSLDNWNSYMADLKRLGLDELIQITQARIDRGR